MKSHVNVPGYASAFATRSWARFSPSKPDPGLGKHAELLERHVLDRREDLHVGWVAAGGGDLGPDALEVLPDRLRPQAPDQLNHTNPACRPVMPRSRRCEKNRASSRADRAQLDVVHGLHPGPLELVARDRLQVEVPAWRTRSPYPANTSRTSSPTS